MELCYFSVITLPRRFLGGYQGPETSERLMWGTGLTRGLRRRGSADQIPVGDAGPVIAAAVPPLQVIQEVW